MYRPYMGRQGVWRRYGVRVGGLFIAGQCMLILLFLGIGLLLMGTISTVASKAFKDSDPNIPQLIGIAFLAIGGTIFGLGLIGILYVIYKAKQESNATTNQPGHVISPGVTYTDQPYPQTQLLTDRSYPPGQPFQGQAYSPGQPYPPSNNMTPGQPYPAPGYQPSPTTAPGQPYGDQPYHPNNATTQGQPYPAHLYQPGQPNAGQPYPPGDVAPGQTYAGEAYPQQPPYYTPGGPLVSGSQPQGQTAQGTYQEKQGFSA